MNMISNWEGISGSKATEMNLKIEMLKKINKFVWQKIHCIRVVFSRSLHFLARFPKNAYEWNEIEIDYCMLLFFFSIEIMIDAIDPITWALTSISANEYVLTVLISAASDQSNSYFRVTRTLAYNVQTCIDFVLYSKSGR